MGKVILPQCAVDKAAGVVAGDRELGPISHEAPFIPRSHLGFCVRVLVPLHCLRVFRQHVVISPPPPRHRFGVPQHLRGIESSAAGSAISQRCGSKGTISSAATSRLDRVHADLADMAPARGEFSAGRGRGPSSAAGKGSQAARWHLRRSQRVPGERGFHRGGNGTVGRLD